MKEVHMYTSQFYIAVSIVIVVIVALLIFLAGRNKKYRLTPLEGLAFGFILAGILFGSDRVIGYGLFGVGIILAVVDFYKRSKRK